MKKTIITFAVLVSVVLIVTPSCKKKKSEEPETPASASTTTSTENGDEAYDNWRITSENDGAFSDINTVISDNVALSGRTTGGTSVMGNICGMNPDTTGMAVNGTVQLNYTGINCNNRIRTGSIKLTIQNYGSGVRWKNINAVVKVEYFNYKVVYNVTGQSTQLNGTAYLTNISGGTWFNLIFMGQPNLIHGVNATGLNVVMNNTLNISYNVNRQTTYTYSSGVVTAANTGMANIGGYTNVESYGTVASDSVYCKVINPVVWNTTCGAWFPVTGNVTVKVKSKAYTLDCIFGTDISGTPVTPSPSACPYGMRINWTIGSITSGKTIGYL